MENIFKSKETKKTFFAWASLANYHPEDEIRFYEFARQYYNADEEVNREVFVKAAKAIHQTTLKHHRGMFQKYYLKLETIIGFLKLTNNHQY